MRKQKIKKIKNPGLTRSESKHKNALDKQLLTYRQSNCKTFWMFEIVNKKKTFKVSISDCDLDFCQDHVWHAHAKRKNEIYVSTKLKDENGQQYSKMLHQLLFTPEPNEFCDHLDRDRFNNKQINFASKTMKQNNQNRSKNPNASSIYLGVKWQKNAKKYVANIVLNKQIYLGRFKTETEAGIAYNYASHLANKLTAHRIKCERNMFVCHSENLQLEEDLENGLVQNLTHDKMVQIYQLVASNI